MSCFWLLLLDLCVCFLGCCLLVWIPACLRPLGSEVVGGWEGSLPCCMESGPGQFSLESLSFHFVFGYLMVVTSCLFLVNGFSFLEVPLLVQASLSFCSLSVFYHLSTYCLSALLAFCADWVSAVVIRPGCLFSLGRFRNKYRLRHPHGFPLSFCLLQWSAGSGNCLLFSTCLSSEV